VNQNIIDSAILSDPELLATFALGDTLPDVLGPLDGIDRLLRGDPVNIAPLVYRGLS